MRVNILGHNTLIPVNARFFVPLTTSSMDEARSLAKKHPAGFVRTDFQSAGRGRLPERSWRVDAGTGFMGTFWFPVDTFAGAPLPHLAGLAVVRACSLMVEKAGHEFRNPLQLKWPNDVLCGERKLAGILCESSGGTAYAGIGINCLQSTFSGSFRMEPTSIFLETGFAANPESLVTELINAFSYLALYPEIWHAEYESIMAYRGSKVRFRPGIDLAPVTGTIVGVGSEGSLIMELEKDGVKMTRQFVSGEIEACVSPTVIDADHST